MNQKLITNNNSRKRTSPLVSIVIPVYNAGEFLVEALESILNQTYKNIEIVTIDDASTDNSYEILERFAHKYPKITLLKNRRNEGISRSVKKAIQRAKGEYIARMDADDIALPARIEKQVEYLLSHPSTVAIGGQCFLINSSGNVIGKKTFPTAFEQIYQYIFHFVPVQQPTLMIARSRLPRDFEFYQDGMNTAEEVELFFKLFMYGKVENLSQYVLMYRLHDGNTSLSNVRKTFLLTLLSRIKAVVKYGYKPTFIGILMTFMQTIIILTVPQPITLFIYKIARNMVIYKPFTLSPFSPATVPAHTR